MSKKPVFVYILYCENDSYYTGYTTNLDERIQSHFEGTGRCKYTRSFKPLHVAASWEIVGTKALAMRIERYIKSLSRPKKEALIANPAQLFKALELADVF